MIKLIASDLDGTLLQNEAQALEPYTLEVIRRVRKKGIIFVAASGRQYLNLRHLFGPLSKELMFIAENGTIAVYQDRVIHKSVIPRDLGVELMRDICAIDDCEVLLSGQYTCYLMPKQQSYADHMLYTVKNTVTYTEDIYSVHEDMLKISAFMHTRTPEEISDLLSPKWSEYFTIAVSGRQWIDFTLSNKGAALRRIQDDLGLRREEMMAFGDNFNDEHMLGLVKYGYAMDNADPKVKAMCDYGCRRVEEVLEALLEGYPDWLPDPVAGK